jgi:membrane protein implicated in regulation of membrane protease activity
MSDPEVWRWVWLATAVVFAIGEAASAGAFFLLPFAVGAVVAAVLAFAGAGLGLEWLAFVTVSAASVAALRPLARRLDNNVPSLGIGAKRWQGETAIVLRAIPRGPSETGLVRVGREEWRAESVDGSGIAEGTVVRVVDVIGTRLRVWPVDRSVPKTDNSQGG